MSKRAYASALSAAPESAKLAQFTLEDVDYSSETYDASEFGGFSDYMRRKKLKLQNQDAQMRANADPTLPKIFAGMVLHINGYTKPGRLDLWKLIVSHGGVYKQFLEKKTDVTHIVASNLTRKKEQEFEKYRVVRPEWITDSIAEGRALPWSQYSTIIQEGQQRQLLPSMQSSDEMMLSKKHSAITSNSYKTATIQTPSLRPQLDQLQSTEVAQDDPGFNIGVKTATHPDFIQDYYSKSRLHHLSAWKADLRLRIHNMQQPCQSRRQKVVMHIDFDCFFAAVSSRDRKDLIDVPTAVTHGGANSGEIASCNYVARKSGVKNGMWMKEAIILCPELVSLPYNFAAYEEISNKFFNSLLQLNASCVEAVSIDEALVDITNLLPPHQIIDDVVDHAKSLVKRLRDEIFQDTQCTVSAGLGSCVLQAKLATKMAKPAGQFIITTANLASSLDQFDVRDLPGVGHATASKISEATSANSLHELQQVSETTLKNLLGVNLGRTIYRGCRGLDDQTVGSISDRKLVSIEINWGIRFKTAGEVQDFQQRVSRELRTKLIAAGFTSARHVLLKVMRRAKDASIDPPKFLGHGKCDKVNAGREISSTSDAESIARHSISLMDQLSIPPDELRGIGVALTKLGSAVDQQRSMIAFMQEPRSDVPKNLKHLLPNLDGVVQANTVTDSKKEKLDAINLDQMLATKKAVPAAAQQKLLQKFCDPPPEAIQRVSRDMEAPLRWPHNDRLSNKPRTDPTQVVNSRKPSEPVADLGIKTSENLNLFLQLPGLDSSELGPLGRADLDEAKVYISRWIAEESAGGPDLDGARDFGQYFTYLIRERDLERVESLMQWLRLRTLQTEVPAWKELCEQLMKSVSHSLQEAGLPELQGLH